jgi:adenine phosphoribosyltransferase
MIKKNMVELCNNNLFSKSTLTVRSIIFYILDKFRNMTNISDLDYLSKQFKIVDNFPHSGIKFFDIAPVFNDPRAFKIIINALIQRYNLQKINKICAIEARGFVIASALAYQLNVGLVMMRKKGKLPRDVISQSCNLEYGTAILEMQCDAVIPKDNVLLIDDIIATGGTMQGCIKLIHSIPEVKIIECAAVAVLPKLGGYKMLQQQNIPVYSIIDLL